MKALSVERNTRRFAAAKLMSYASTKKAVEYGPLSLVEIDPPRLPTDEWIRLRTRLAGICGSDLASLTLRTSRYFEPITAFPLTPGHEIVAEIERAEGTTRYVIEPALTCVPRGRPLCRFCSDGMSQLCESITEGTIDEGIQLGYCSSTGGGWAQEFVAHSSQLWAVPSALTDEDAVMIEPLACAIHVALQLDLTNAGSVGIIGAGTVGLTTLSVLRQLYPDLTIVIGARHAAQRNAAQRLGASHVVKPEELNRVGRRLSGAMVKGDWQSHGFDVIFDCIASADSLHDALVSVRPRGSIVLAGMPAKTTVDLALLWHQEIHLLGSYAYGEEELNATQMQRLGVANKRVNDDQVQRVRTFEIALALMSKLHLGWMVTHTYPLDNYLEAIERASAAGRLDALKVAFDLRRSGNERKQ